jgi:hypothetical protein
LKKAAGARFLSESPVLLEAEFLGIYAHRPCRVDYYLAVIVSKYTTYVAADLWYTRRERNLGALNTVLLFPTYFNNEMNIFIEMNTRFKLFGGLAVLLLVSAGYCADNWNQVYSTGNMSVYSLGTFDGKLYAGEGGGMSGEGADGGAHLYSFDGSNWSASSHLTAQGGIITSIKEYNNNLYFSEINGYPYGTLWMLNGSNFSLMYSEAYNLLGGNTFMMESLVVYDGRLYAGKRSTMDLADYYPNIPSIIVYNGTSWSSSYLADARIPALKVFDGKLYAGVLHEWPQIDGNVNIMSFNGTTWSPSHNGTWLVTSFEEYDGLLYAGTNSSILILNGTTWWTACKTDSEVRALKSFNGKLYAAMLNGGILSYNGTACVASYDKDKTFYALEAFGGRLYAGQGASVHLNEGGVMVLQGVTTTTTTTSTTTSTTSTSSTITSTTSTTLSACLMPGNNPPCRTVELSEVISGINEWATGGMTLGEVIDLINSWADPAGHAPN